ncbi:serine hydrolase-like protein [Monomorium pharaonis]|uniref:serine hydrolase-like protein n=1 Tax=Monomorium pharaonis TaxID=307658 RepID=UPI001747631A|nr:serine hydrolase-like protein [Monomorium pharaonis]
MAVEFAEIKLSVPWGHVAARTYGSSTGQPILVLHGIEDNAGAFTRLMKYLPKKSFYYVCVDLPGHGWSSSFPSWMMIDWMDYAHSLYFILDALQWKTCTVLGHSLGGQTALMFSIFQPDRFEKIISIDGLLMMPRLVKDLVTYFQTASALSVKDYREKFNKKPSLFTKEEILHSLTSKRYTPLNYEAANAIFERTVTEENGKYIHNRDVRLKNHPFSWMLMDESIKLSERLPMIPIYVFVASHGVCAPFKEECELILDIMKAKTMLEVIYVDGNHDVHNNDPEKVAPFICKILNSSNSSKL